VYLGAKKLGCFQARGRCGRGFSKGQTQVVVMDEA